MNLLQAIFGRREYVMLKTATCWKRSRAYERCGSWYAAPYLSDDTTTRLLPGGKVEGGPCYVLGWQPDSRGTEQLFHTGKSQT